MHDQGDDTPSKEDADTLPNPNAPPRQLVCHHSPILKPTNPPEQWDPPAPLKLDVQYKSGRGLQIA